MLHNKCKTPLYGSFWLSFAKVKLFFHEIHIILLVYKALVGRNILWQQQTWGSRQFSLAVTKKSTEKLRAQAGVHTCLARTSWCAHMFCAHKLVCTHV